MYQEEDLGDVFLHSHETIGRAVIYVNGFAVDDTYYQKEYVDIVQEDSYVEEDRNAATRATCGATFRWINDDANDLLDPLTFPEIALYSGVMINGSPKWVPLGLFGLNDRTNTNMGGTEIRSTVSGMDRSDRVRTNPWKQPYQVAKGTDYFTAGNAIVTDRAKGFTVSANFGANVLTTPTLTFSDETDPWDAVMKLAEAVGCETFFDRLGVWNMHSIPDPEKTAPNLELRRDETGIILSPVTAEVSNQNVFNGVIVRGEAPWLLFPISGEAWDDDPSSPTWRGGPFGEKPKIIGDALATTDAQCLAAAQAEFLKVKGAVENINFSLVKDPRITVGDIIYLYDDRMDLTGRYVLDTLRIPVGNAPMTGTVRRRR